MTRVRVRVVRPYSTAEQLDRHLMDRGMESITKRDVFAPRREVPEDLSEDDGEGNDEPV